MFRFTITSHTLVWVATILVAMLLPAAAVASRPPLPKDLEITAERFFSTTKGYQQGDLLTLSQLVDLQKYIRQSQGISLATHYKWRKRMLKDQAALAKKFRAGGAPVLRQVSAELGGYEELNRLSLKGEGRKQIQAAIDANTPESLLEALAAERARIEALPEPQRKRATQPSRRIYTVSDFMRVLKPAEPELKAEPQSQSNSPRSGEASVEAMEKETVKNAEDKRQE